MIMRMNDACELGVARVVEVDGARPRLGGPEVLSCSATQRSRHFAENVLHVCEAKVSLLSALAADEVTHRREPVTESYILENMRVGCFSVQIRILEW